MEHSLANLIPQLIQIEENFSRLYSNVATIDGQYNQRLKTAAMVLSRQEKDHASKYRELIDTIQSEGLTVDEEIYHKIRKILMDFKKSIQKVDLKELNDLLSFAIESERETGKILKSIRAYDLPPALNTLLDELIAAENLHASTLEQFLKK